MTKQIKYDWKKCVCRKTHTSGTHGFIENQIYRYKENMSYVTKYIEIAMVIIVVTHIYLMISQSILRMLPN